MISIYKIKPGFQKLLSPILVGLHKIGVTANQITWSSIFLSLLIGIAFWFADAYRFLFLALPFGLLVRMALNALDGMMARTYNQQTKEGEVLNELGDVISDVFIYFPLLVFEKQIIYLVVLFMSLSIINEFAGLIGKALSGERRYDGPMGKSDRAFVMGIYGVFSFLSIDFKLYSNWFFSVIIILLVISTAIRINKALKAT
ncbi:CDP-alcohol phosphatidyltransferase family protein [bacterium]|nr:CDP-alcohol phosphatidyltransferase family protein [bacterium]NUN46285.1 CDP-alcohol phosphatidyltransferase family protein [bacterium]